MYGRAATESKRMRCRSSLSGRFILRISNGEKIMRDKIFLEADPGNTSDSGCRERDGSSYSQYI